MRTRFREAMAVALLLLAPVAGRGADVSFAYQGLLLDEKGHLLPARNHSIVFCIYDQASGGSPLWTCTRDVLLDEKGQFSVELSGNAISGDGLCELLAANAPSSLYVGLTVDGDSAEISPRQRLMSVPKAFRAEDSVAARGDMAVSNALSGSSASLRSAAANALSVANKLECGGPLQVHSMTNGSLAVGGSITGKGVIPVGGIIVWSGSQDSIPAGWALCDGNLHYGRQTPNLRNRFIVGAGTKGGANNGIGEYKVGAVGGADTVTLSVAQLPPHTHWYSFTSAALELVVNGNTDYYYCPENSGYSQKTKTTEPAGGGQAHENRPPFYALCYIMRVI